MGADSLAMLVPAVENGGHCFGAHLDPFHATPLRIEQRGTVVGGTPRIPSAVIRIAGGIA